jgi:hypothetical protein
MLWTLRRPPRRQVQIRQVLIRQILIWQVRRPKTFDLSTACVRSLCR